MPVIIDKLVGNADRANNLQKLQKSLDLSKIKDPNINLDDYEEFPKQAIISTQILIDMWNRLGRPNTPFTENGAKLLNIIISIWEDGFPKDARQWHEDRKEHLNAEMSISEQVSRKTGRSLASFPGPVYNMMRKCFHGFEPAERNNCIKLVKKWPIFKMVNKI